MRRTLSISMIICSAAVMCGHAQFVDLWQKHNRGDRAHALDDTRSKQVGDLKIWTLDDTSLDCTTVLKAQVKPAFTSHRCIPAGRLAAMDPAGHNLVGASIPKKTIVTGAPSGTTTNVISTVAIEVRRKNLNRRLYSTAPNAVIRSNSEVQYKFTLGDMVQIFGFKELQDARPWYVKMGDLFGAQADLPDGTCARIVGNGQNGEAEWLVRLPSGKNMVLPTLNLRPLVTFQPTTEWQLVPAWQILPGGLDIQMNMTTGERWARVPVDETDDADDKVDTVDTPDTNLTDDTSDNFPIVPFADSAESLDS